MWRKLPTIVAVLLFTTALAFASSALVLDDWRWLLAGCVVFLAAFLYLIWLELRRLTSDWPPGIIFAAGAEAERRKRRRRGKRGSHDLVTVEGGRR